MLLLGSPMTTGPVVLAMLGDFVDGVLADPAVEPSDAAEPVESQDLVNE